MSIVVGLELVFRNQTSYSRFWSGRLHLNTYTTAIRNISRQILVLVPAPAAPKAMPVSQDCDSACASGYATPVIGSTTPNGSVYHGIYGSTDEAPLDKEMEYKTLEVVKILIAMLYSVKNHLRADWGVSVAQGIQITGDGEVVTTEEYKDLLPQGMKGYEHRGLGLTLQLTTFVEDYINIGVQK